ncbi:MAG: hypothetical protein CMJ84_03310 [Planctomycetes bacterium]|jgi:diguanylate cyclase (GGDEF)-like protein|nr:hypothetical protein [Planctomycetota bacterium]MDP6408364.1 GGDEF domain-containing protein [Planctomycetota bacterium]
MILICDHRGEGLEEILSPTLLEAELEFVFCRSPRQTRERLTQHAPDAIVLDPLSAGGQVELEEIDRLRGDEEAVPILLVIERDDPLPGMEAARSLSGSTWDIVHREATPTEYLLRLERLLYQGHALEEVDDLRYRASHDDRTELLRPRVFQARLAEQFSAAQRHALDMALVIVDLDNFGRINKEFDHTVGDLVISRVGDVIKHSLRAEDIGARLGGDEFAVLLPYTDQVDTARVVARLRDSIERLSGHIGRGEREVVVGASIGFETCDGSDLESVEVLRQHAEIALRHAKRSGGNQGVYYRCLL